MDLTTLHVSAEAIAASLTAGGICLTILVRLRGAVRKASEACRKLLVVPDQMETVAAQIGKLEKEFRPNGGSTLVDQIARVGTGVESTRADVQAVQAQLTRLARKQRASLHLNQTCLMEFNEKGHCVFVNQAFLRSTGRSEAECTGTGWLMALAPEERADFMEAWQHAIDTHSNFEADTVLLSTTGVRLRGHLQFSTIVETDDAVYGWLGAILIQAAPAE